MRVLKWPVFVDDHPHTIGAGPIVSVGLDPSSGGRPDLLAVWTLEDDTVLLDRRVLVVGTGHKLPESSRPIGTVVTPPYAWHVVVLPTEAG